MSVVTGVVEGINRKYEGKVGVLVGEKWYNTKTEYFNESVVKGCEVQFDDGNGRNFFSKVKILSGGGSGSPAPSSTGAKPSANGALALGKSAKDRVINRQNALTNAVAFCKYGTKSGDLSSVDEVIEVAQQFEHYTCGDLAQVEHDMAKEAIS